MPTSRAFSRASRACSASGYSTKRYGAGSLARSAPAGALSRSAYLGDSYDQSLRRLVVANTHIGTRNSIAVRAGPLAALRACRLARLGGGRARRRAPAADHRCAVARFCRSGPRAHQAPIIRPIIQAPPNAPTCPVQARGAKTCKQRYTSTSPSMVGIAVSRRTSPPTPRSSDESARHAAMTPVQLLR